MEGTIGEIRLFAASFAPREWSFCNGGLIPISSNTALFSVLGTTYGGDGIKTFALPNLNGRTAIGAGHAPGLSPYPLGQISGASTLTLTAANLPPHTHETSAAVALPVYSESGNANTPSGNILAAKANMYSREAPDTSLVPASFNVQIAGSGNSIPLNITQPYLGMNYIICLYGQYPQRS